jgi:SpoVK/Ycf46/Vps4 family AAA+-type ATPase
LHELLRSAKSRQPAIILVEALDSLFARQENYPNQLDAKLLSEFRAVLDELSSDSSKICILGTCKSSSNLDPSLLQAGRFQREIVMSIPNDQARRGILVALLEQHGLSGEAMDYAVSVTQGFWGADLAKLARQFMSEVQQSGVMDSMAVQLARARVSPSSMTESIVKVTKTAWSDIGGNHVAKQRLKEMIIWPREHKETFKRLGIAQPRGILLFGPPGNAKTVRSFAFLQCDNYCFIDACQGRCE